MLIEARYAMLCCFIVIIIFTYFFLFSASRITYNTFELYISKKILEVCLWYGEIYKCYPKKQERTRKGCSGCNVLENRSSNNYKGPQTKIWLQCFKFSKNTV